MKISLGAYLKTPHGTFSWSGLNHSDSRIFLPSPISNGFVQEIPNRRPLIPMGRRERRLVEDPVFMVEIDQVILLYLYRGRNMEPPAKLPIVR